MQCGKLSLSWFVIRGHGADCLLHHRIRPKRRNVLVGLEAAQDLVRQHRRRRRHDAVGADDNVFDDGTSVLRVNQLEPGGHGAAHRRHGIPVPRVIVDVVLGNVKRFPIEKSLFNKFPERGIRILAAAFCSCAGGALTSLRSDRARVPAHSDSLSVGESQCHTHAAGWTCSMHHVANERTRSRTCSRTALFANSRAAGGLRKRTRS